MVKKTLHRVKKYIVIQAFFSVLTKTQLTKNSKELNFLAFFGKNSIFFGNSTDLLQILLHKKSKKGQKFFKELTENAKNSIFDYIRS